MATEQSRIESGTDTPPQLAPGEPDYAGPFGVGNYAKKLAEFLKGRERVRLIGEVCNYRGLRSPAIYFELRDGEGAIPCAMWRNSYDRLDLPDGALVDGAEVVVAGHLDYFPGNSGSSPRFSFRVTYLRLAGEGDLLAQLAELRRKLEGDGVFEPQKRLVVPKLPKTIGIVTGRDSAARADLLAGLERRGWRGRVIFGYSPVQGASAAPKIAAAAQGLAAIEEVETIIVARGGGSLSDLWAFCDESLCRTISLLRVPVIAAVGHETDRTLIDDVAAISCSTPTHAPAAAVGVDVTEELVRVGTRGVRLQQCSEAAVSARASGLAGFARGLGHHTRAQRGRLHQLIREIRASGRRAIDAGMDRAAISAEVLRRKQEATSHLIADEQPRIIAAATALGSGVEATTDRRAEALARLAATLSAHDPDRVLARGYAMAQTSEGELINTAAGARAAGSFRVRFADDHVGVELKEEDRRDD